MRDQNLIFLSCASPDRETVITYYDYLIGAGFDVWMDKFHLKGGQNWDFEIKRALQKAAIVVVFLSHDSVDRQGYAQREIKIALDQAQDRLVDDIYVIPVLLERSVPIPEQLNRIQAIGLDEGDPLEATKDAIAHQLTRLGVQTAKVQAEANIRWTMISYRDAWEGLPGYEISFELPNFTSSLFPQVSEITDVVRGGLQAAAMSHREMKFNQTPQHYSFGEEKYRRQDSWEATCGEPVIKERVVSLIFSEWWFGAKAMHPNQAFRTFVFTLNPVTELASLRTAFADEDAALALIQRECRERLLGLRFEGMTNDDTVLSLDADWVEDGTKEWDHFNNFAFSQEGIDILFSHYSVAAYAFGPQAVQIPYNVVAPLMRRDMACFLGIEHLHKPFSPLVSHEPEKSVQDSSAQENLAVDPANDQSAA